MKLTVKNLGRIKDAELDIQPLTVFIGPTNTQKSWTAYALFGLMKVLSDRLYRDVSLRILPSTSIKLPASLVDCHVSMAAMVLERLLDEFSVNGEDVENQSSPVQIRVEVTREQILEDLSGSLVFGLQAENLAKVLAIQEEILTDAEVTLEWPVNKFQLKKKFRKISFVSEPGTSLGADFQDSQGRSAFSAGVPLFGDATRQRQIIESTVTDCLWHLILAAIPCTIAFPAERKALMSIYKFFHDELQRDRFAHGTIFRGLGTLPVLDYAAFLGELDSFATFLPSKRDTDFFALQSYLNEKYSMAHWHSPAPNRR